MKLEIDTTDLLNAINQGFQNLQMKPENNTFASTEELPITLKQMSKETGISVAALTKYIYNGYLPRHQIGKNCLLVLYRSEVNEAIKRHKLA